MRQHLLEQVGKRAMADVVKQGCGQGVPRTLGGQALPVGEMLGVDREIVPLLSGLSRP